MSIRKGYIYALLLAVGLLLWSEAISAWQEAPAESVQTNTAVDSGVQPWTSAEAVYACSMKAQELGLTLSSMSLAIDGQQGSLVLTGSRTAMQDFLTWLEQEGRFRQILSCQLRADDEAASRLSISYQL